jgi:PTH1 family peptidyl-tRNA hydrolase
VRPEGGSGGNRGAASVASALGTEGFPRIRVGVGRPPPGWDSADYVLSRFGADERPEIDRAVDRAGDAALAIVRSGVAAAMNEFN